MSKHNDIEKRAERYAEERMAGVEEESRRILFEPEFAGLRENILKGMRNAAATGFIAGAEWQMFRMCKLLAFAAAVLAALCAWARWS